MGAFRTEDQSSSDSFIAKTRKMLSSKKADTDVSHRVLVDLLAIQKSLLLERERVTATECTDREKGKRLLYLFQCDLLPGVSGKILEAKDQRDFAIVRKVHPFSKLAGWSFILLFNAAMLSYILLFALTQSSSRQGAWAASFAVWLVVEILLVSSVVVMMVHVLIPSLILKDVAKIKKKLVENIRDFNRSVKGKSKSNAAVYEEQEQDEDANFNAADYLFLSTRLAKELPDLKEAKIIAQFKTPWPKHSYQHVSNVSKAYSKKFSAFTRSFSIILIFVITTFLNVPPSVQDMFMQMLSTVVIGYVALLHIELFIIFPVLVVLPLLIVGIVVHFFIQSGKAEEKLRIQRLMKELEPDLAEIHPQDEQDGDFWAGGTGPSNPKPDANVGETDAVDAGDSDHAEDRSSDGSFDGKGYQEEEEEEQFASNIGLLHTPLFTTPAAVRGVGVGAVKHVTRRQSIQQGLRLVQRVQASLNSSEDSEDGVSLPTPAYKYRDGTAAGSSDSDGDDSSTEDSSEERDGTGRSDDSSSAESSSGYSSSSESDDDTDDTQDYYDKSCNNDDDKDDDDNDDDDDDDEDTSGSDSSGCGDVMLASGVLAGHLNTSPSLSHDSNAIARGVDLNDCQSMPLAPPPPPQSLPLPHTVECKQSTVCEHGGDSVLPHTVECKQSTVCEHGGDSVLPHTVECKQSTVCEHGGDSVLPHTVECKQSTVCEHGGDSSGGGGEYGGDHDYTHGDVSQSKPALLFGSASKPPAPLSPSPPFSAPYAAPSPLVSSFSLADGKGDDYETLNDSGGYMSDFSVDCSVGASSSDQHSTLSLPPESTEGRAVDGNNMEGTAEGTLTSVRTYELGDGGASTGESFKTGEDKTEGRVDSGVGGGGTSGGDDDDEVSIDLSEFSVDVSAGQGSTAEEQEAEYGDEDDDDV